MKQILSKKCCHLLVSLFILLSYTGIMAAPPSSTAKPCSIRIHTNERNHHYVHGYTINGSNYFRLKDMATVLNNTSSEFDITQNKVTKALEIKLQQPYHLTRPTTYQENYEQRTNKTVSLKTIPFIIDGKSTTLEGCMINNENYLKLKDMGTVFNFKSVSNQGKELNAEPAISITTQATSYMTYIENVTPTDMTWGSMDRDCTQDRWPGARSTYLFKNDDGTLSYVQVGTSRLNIYNHNAQFEIINNISIPRELTLLGGVYKAHGFYYVLYGENNIQEIGNAEVYRLVKYDSAGNRIAHISINGKDSFTQMPFSTPTVSMAINGDELTIHTNRQRFKSADGLNHQSNLTFVVDAKNMTLKSVSTPFPDNHVSHSFNQLVKYDGNTPIFVDHGDAYPRSICLQRGKSLVDLFEISGNLGDNFTGVQVGGFEVSNDSYIVVGTSIDQQEFNPRNTQTNLFMSITSKSNLNENKLIWLTSYDKNENKRVGVVPKLVKINDDRFMIMWKETLRRPSAELTVSNALKYLIIDGKGNIIESVKEVPYVFLADHTPIVYNNHIVWMIHNGSSTIAYHLPISSN